MSIGEMLCTNVCNDIMAEFMQMTTPRNMSYMKITQKHLFSTAVSSLHTLRVIKWG